MGGVLEKNGAVELVVSKLSLSRGDRMAICLGLRWGRGSILLALSYPPLSSVVSIIAITKSRNYNKRIINEDKTCPN